MGFVVFLGDVGLICDNSRNLNLKKAFKETTIYNFINNDGFLIHVLLHKTLLIFDNFVLHAHNICKYLPMNVWHDREVKAITSFSYSC